MKQKPVLKMAWRPLHLNLVYRKTDMHNDMQFYAWCSAQVLSIYSLFVSESAERVTKDSKVSLSGESGEWCHLPNFWIYNFF